MPSTPKAAPAAALACKLCGSQKLELRAETAPQDVAQAYRFLYGIDLAAVGSAPSGSAIALMRCSRCELLQFTPDWIGSPGLYEALQVFPWYYQVSKFEFEASKHRVLPGAQVLEVGCATGHFRQHLPPDINYTGLEFNQKAIDAARQRGLNVSAVALEEMAHSHAGQFDSVFAFQVLEHVPEPRQFLLDMVRAAKTGGLVVFSVPSEDSFLRHEVNNVSNLPPHHATRWPDATFKRLGELIGAELVSIEHEPLTAGHRRAYANAQVWRVLSRVLARARSGVWPLASQRWARGLVALAGLPTRLWVRLAGVPLRGHTVLVTLRKL